MLPQPFKSNWGWHVVKVRDRRDRRESSLDEVADQVRRDVTWARRGEVTEQYIQELLDARKVKFYPRAFVESGADDGSHEDE